MLAFFKKITTFFMSLLAFLGLIKPSPAAPEAPAEPTAPARPVIRDGVSPGRQGTHHVQGIAVDEENGFIYWSFTTRLVKTDFAGNPLGSVEGLAGHLGCISFNPADGMVYGSLEYKHDSIGQGILDGTGAEVTDGFYIAVFDVSAITREGMSAEADGVMRAAFLPEATADYLGEGVNAAGAPVPHRYGCSGIDGLCFAPAPGAPAGERFLYVAYGVYADDTRCDNDHQILLRYRTDAVKSAARPLAQGAMHRCGPGAPESKYFVYTGNTEYGVQNLEYDAASRALLMAVYRGRKAAFTNYDIYAADLSLPARDVPLAGLNETGAALTLLGSPGPESAEIRGWYFPCGQFGIHARQDGAYYIAEPAEANGEQTAAIRTFRFDPANGFTLPQ